MKHGLKIILAVLALLIAARPAPASLIDKLEWKLEKHFGKSVKAEMESEYGFLDDPLLANYIGGMGARCVAVSHRTDIPYEFHIIDSDEVNAFAAPGGFIFVTRGLIEEAESDDEVASVVGHETAHVAARHAAKNIKRMPLVIAGLNILNRRYGETTARIGGLAVSLLELHYSREDEYQADRLGLEYSFAAGYDPAGMETFFAKLEKKSRSGDLDRLQVALSSHPKTPSRIREIRISPQMLETADNLARVGDSYMERYYHREAADRYRRALEVEPGRAAAQTGLAAALIEQGEYDRAGEVLASALAARPGDEAAAALLNEKLPRSREKWAETAAAPADAQPPFEKELIDLAGMIDNALFDVRKKNEKLSARSTEMEYAFDAILPALRKTYAKLYDKHIIGDEFFNHASAYWSALASGLRAARDSGAENERALREARRRVREALHAARTSPNEVNKTSLKKFFIAVKELLNNAATEVDTIEYAADDYKETFDAMRRDFEGLERLLELDEPILSHWLEQELMETATRGFKAMVRNANDTAVARGNTLDARAAMRTTALRIAVDTLSPREEEIFRNMVSRRFGVAREKLDAADGPLGFIAEIVPEGRAAALESRVENTIENDLAPADTTLVLPVISTAVRDAAARGLIMHLAEIDLKHLTGASLRPSRLLHPPDFAPEFDPLWRNMETDPELDRAEALLRQGNAEEAGKLLYERGKRAEANPRAYLLLGVAHKHAENGAEAPREFDSALKKGAPAPLAHYLAGAAALLLEEHDRARVEFQTALNDMRESPAALTGAGVALASMGDDDAAKKYFERALEADPQNCAAANNLAIMLAGEGLVKEAEEYFRAAEGYCGGNPPK